MIISNYNTPVETHKHFCYIIEKQPGQAMRIHLSGKVISEGQQVKAGDLIGYSGIGGGVPHLCIHIRQTSDDKRLDPEGYLGITRQELNRVYGIKFTDQR
jgi:hypothetical protein